MADLAKLVLDADTRGLKNAERDLEEVSRKASDAAEKIGGSMRKLGVGLSVGVTAPLTVFAKGAAQAAIDAVELQSMFDTTFGKMSKSMNEWARKTGDAMGRSTQELQQSAAVFQGFFKDMLPEQEAAKFSKTLTILSQDVASFKNLANDDAQRRLFAAVTGEYESLKSLGVVINDTVMKAQAMKMGFGNSTSALTEQEKVLIRVALLQQKFADASGDVARTSDSTANQIKRSQAAFQELQVTVGTKLLPALTPLIEKLGAAFEWFTALPDPVQNVALGAAAVAAALGPVLIGLGTLVSVGGSVVGALGGGLGVAGALGTVAAMLIKLSPLAVAAYVVWQNWDDIAPRLTPIIGNLRDIAEGLGLIGPKAKEAGSASNEAASELADLGTAASNASKMFQSWADKFDAYNKRTAESARANHTTIQDGLRQTWQAFDNFVVNLNSIGARIRAKIAEWGTIGRDMVLGLARGIRDAGPMAWGAVKNVVSGAVAKAKAELGIKSPSRVFMAVGDYIGQGLAQGIEGSTGKVGAAARKMTEAARREAEEVAAILRRLFPDVEKAKNWAADWDRLNKSSLSDADKSNATYRLNREAMGVTGPAFVSVANDNDPLVQADKLTKAALMAGDAMSGLKGKAQITSVQVAKSFQDMANQTMQSLQTLAGAIKGGGFLDILGAVVGLGLQLGSAGAFGKSVANRINVPKVPGYAGGTNFHPGGLAVVGEKRPELVELPRGSRVRPNLDALGGGKLQVEVVANNNGFGAIIRNHAGQVVGESAPGIAASGAQMAGMQMARANSRRW